MYRRPWCSTQPGRGKRHVRRCRAGPSLQLTVLSFRLRLCRCRDGGDRGEGYVLCTPILIISGSTFIGSGNEICPVGRSSALILESDEGVRVLVRIALACCTALAETRIGHVPSVDGPMIHDWEVFEAVPLRPRLRILRAGLSGHS